MAVCSVRVLCERAPCGVCAEFVACGPVGMVSEVALSLCEHMRSIQVDFRKVKHDQGVGSSDGCAAVRGTQRYAGVHCGQLGEFAP